MNLDDKIFVEYSCMFVKIKPGTHTFRLAPQAKVFAAIPPISAKHASSRGNRAALMHSLPTCFIALRLPQTHIWAGACSPRPSLRASQALARSKDDVCTFRVSRTRSLRPVCEALIAHLRGNLVRQGLAG